MTITVKHQSIKVCPLNRQLAEFIEKSRIDPAIALELDYKTEQVEMIPQSVAFSFYKTYQTDQTLDGVSERQGYYKSAVELRLSSKSPLMPVCAMVIAIIPGAFGLYLLRYTCASQLDQVQKEQWDSSTFLMRTLHALPFTDEDGTKLLAELHDIFPQLVSFFSESCAARKLYLKRIGITGQSLV